MKGREIVLQIFLTVLVVTFAAFALWASVWLYAVVLCYLASEYFILLGGAMLWLNKLRETMRFEESGILRNIIATDARLVLIFVVLGLWILIGVEGFHGYRPWKEYDSIPVPDLILLTRLLLLGFVIHAIHSILMYERMIGTRFTHYPPLCRLIRSAILHIKTAGSSENARNQDCHS